MSTKKRLRRQQKVLKALRSDISELAGRDDRLLTRIKKIRRRYRALAPAQASLREDYGKLRGRTKKLERGLGGVQKGAGTLGDQVLRISGEIASLSSRLDGLAGDRDSEEIQTLEQALQRLSGQVLDLDPVVRELVSRQERLSARLGALEQESEGSGRKLEALEGRWEAIDAIQSDVTAISQQISALSTEMAVITDQEKGVGERIAQLSNAQSALAGRQDGIDEQVRTVADSATAERAKVSGCEQAIRRLGVDIGSLQEAETDWRKTAQGQNDRMDTLEGRHEGLAKRAGQIDQEMRRFQDSLLRQASKQQRLSGLVAGGVVILLVAAGLAYWNGSNRFETYNADTKRARDGIEERLTALAGDLREVQQSGQVSVEAEQNGERLQQHLDTQAGELNRQNWRLAANEETLKATKSQLGRVETRQLDISRQVEELTQALAGVQRQAEVGQRATPDAPESAGGMILHGADWLGQRNADHYTIQLIGVHRRAAVRETAVRYALPDPVAEHHRQHNNRDWYVLFYGDYPTLRDAEQAREDLPSPVKAPRPWVISFRQVHEELDRQVETPD